MNLSRRFRGKILTRVPLLIILTVALTMTTAAQISSETQAPQNTAKSPVLYTCDFEAPNWHDAWSWGDKTKRLSLVSEDKERKFEAHDGKALRVHIPKGSNSGSSLVYLFERRHGAEPEEIYFRYYLRLANDWKPETGGKLPGISGTYGKAGWGGRPVNGADGWSARGLFKAHKNGKTETGYYAYQMDMKGRYGSNWLWDKDSLGALENNRWVCIEQHAKMNTPGKANGILRGWINGKLAFEKTDVRMRSVPTLKIQAIWLCVYHGGTAKAKTDHHLYIDDIAISREYIGPKKKQ